LTALLFLVPTGIMTLEWAVDGTGSCPAFDWLLKYAPIRGQLLKLNGFL